jgi:serine protease Do
VVEGSAAEKAGVKSGDIIIKFNGKKIRGASHLKNLVGREKPGAQTTVTIFRDGKEKTLDVKIGEKTPEALAKAGKPPEKETASNELGIEVRPTPVEKANRWGIKPGRGVEITEIDMDGVAAEMGLRQGDVILEVNGAQIDGVDAFEKAISKLKKGEVVRLKIQRNNMRLFRGAPLD